MTSSRVLVVGGCGFVGYHVVRALKTECPSWSIFAASRSPTKNLQDGVEYMACDLTSPAQVREVLRKVKPAVIINTASPTAELNNFSAAYFLLHNLGGTRNLFEAAVEVGGVAAFIYTSSVSVHLSKDFRGLTEDAPVYEDSTPTQNYYSKSKALADTYVLQQNGVGGIRTCALRVCGIYGERDNQMIPNSLGLLREGRQKMRIGRASVQQDFTSVENVAYAHILAAKVLLKSQGDDDGSSLDGDGGSGSGSKDRSKDGGRRNNRVAGEAFFITDNQPIAFFDFARKIWAAAGDSTSLHEVKQVPAWLILSLASVVEWTYWLFTFGTKRPAKFRRHALEYICLDRIYCIDKAKLALGYHPRDNRDESIRRGVEWAMKQNPDVKKSA